MMTFLETLTHLKRIGYGEDLSLHFRQIQGEKEAVPLSPSEYQIDEVYRLEELSDPEEQLVIYAISSADGVRRGHIINGYGPYSDSWTNRLLENLAINEDHDQSPLSVMQTQSLESRRIT